MKSTIWKRFGSILMVLIMVFTIIPDIGVTVKAQPRENETAQGQDNTYPISVTTAEGYVYASIKNEDGTTERVNKAVPGEKIYLEFSDWNMTPGTGFAKWVDDNGNLTDLTNETNYFGCSFTMPEGEVKIHAELAQNCPTVIVENGRIMLHEKGEGFYILNSSSVTAGREIYLDFDESKTPENKIFKEWYVKSGNVELKKGEGFYILNSSSVTAGREIYLDFDESKTPENKIFKEWYVKSGNVELNDPTSMYNCKFIVPNEDVEIGVIYDDTEGTYPISVTAADGYPSAVVKNEDGTIKRVDRAVPGEKIHLEFSDYDMTSGTGFARWVDDNGNLTDLTNETSYYGCSFTMPEGEVKIHAELAQNCPTVTVENGNLTDLTNETSYYGCSFTMPEGEVKIHAELAQNCPTVTVENGRIMVHSEEGDFYILNSSSVIAGREIYLDFDESKTPENKIFKEWYVKSGNVELSDPTNYNCKLTVPNEDVEIGVIYEKNGM